MLLDMLSIGHEAALWEAQKGFLEEKGGNGASSKYKPGKGGGVLFQCFASESSFLLPIAKRFLLHIVVFCVCDRILLPLTPASTC